MADLCYITLDEAIEIHKLTVQHSGGGALGHFDLGRLDSVLQNIQNDDYYPSFVDKITHLFFCACEFHCFRRRKQTNRYYIISSISIEEWLFVCGTIFSERNGKHQLSCCCRQN